MAHFAHKWVTQILVKFYKNKYYCLDIQDIIICNGYCVEVKYSIIGNIACLEALWIKQYFVLICTKFTVTTIFVFILRKILNYD